MVGARDSDAKEPQQVESGFGLVGLSFPSQEPRVSGWGEVKHEWVRTLHNGVRAMWVWTEDQG